MIAGSFSIEPRMWVPHNYLEGSKAMSRIGSY